MLKLLLLCIISITLISCIKETPKDDCVYVLNAFIECKEAYLYPCGMHLMKCNSGIHEMYCVKDVMKICK